MTARRIIGPTGRRFAADLSGTGGRELALILPGLRYGCERPLLAETAALMAARGADLMRLDLAYLEDHELFARSDRDQFAEIEADGRAILDAALGWADWPRVTVIGKSLGTVQMAGLFARPLPSGFRMVWLTPVLARPGLVETDFAGVPGFSLIGSRDPSAARARGARWAGRAGMTHLELAGFDHAWAHEDGADAAAAGTARAMAALAGWLDATA